MFALYFGIFGIWNIWEHKKQKYLHIWNTWYTWTLCKRVETRWQRLDPLPRFHSLEKTPEALGPIVTSVGLHLLVFVYLYIWGGGIFFDTGCTYWYRQDTHMGHLQHVYTRFPLYFHGLIPLSFHSISPDGIYRAWAPNVYFLERPFLLIGELYSIYIYCGCQYWYTLYPLHKR